MASAALSACRRSRPAGAPHDCLELHYAEGDKLFLPVENLELLSRYGSEDTDVQLDQLGGVGWQKRKARMRKRILEMAAGLIKIAAARQTKAAPKLVPPEGLYAEFCAGFPYDETDDQQAAIEAVLEDMASGRPMDRLVCGDVGFGKTEVALRAAFAAAIEGKQVAVIVPTTLLARQHYKNFAGALRASAGQGRANVAHGQRRRSQIRQGSAPPPAKSISSSAPTLCSAKSVTSRISASSLSTRSSISASSTRSG